MRSVQVSKPGGPLEMVEKDIPEPGPMQVRIKVQACGICHSDSFTKDGLFPGIQYPRVPGHEIAGVIDAIGKGIAVATTTTNRPSDWKEGQRPLLAGMEVIVVIVNHVDVVILLLVRYAQVPGISYDGGYSDYVIVPHEAVALVPDGLSATEAAPLMCAGITTYNALRNSGAHPGDVVAILGIGGLGHLGIQFASKMGFKTIAIARGKDEEELVKRLGARQYIDNRSQNAVEELGKLGGAKVILATAPSGKAMSQILGGLAVDGKIVIIGASDEPIEVTPNLFIQGRQSLIGWPQELPLIHKILYHLVFSRV